MSIKRTIARLVMLVALLSLAEVVLINTAVAVLGDSVVSPLSPRRLADKRRALRAYARHFATHPIVHLWGDPDPLPLLEAAARAEGLPVAMVVAVARIESELRPHRISPSAAMGVMQLMPATAAEMGVDDPFDVAQNVDGGVAYLAWLWRRYDGEMARVLAAYNAGPGRVPRQGTPKLPRETRRYVRRVLAEVRSAS